MLCHQCGSPVEADAAACPNCGAELRATKRLRLSESKGLRISQELKAIRFDAQLFPPGEEVANRFVLGEMIGKGPFGEVYRATDKEIDAEVAVKIFDRSVFRNPFDQEKFLSVTRAARSMTQPNVVRIHDSGVHKDHPWVSMQHLEGLSLRKVLDLRLSKGETFGLSELEPIVSQITMALQHVSRDFPHGDLKPENIIFLPDKLKVTDSFVLSALPAETIIPRLKQSPYLAPELHTAKTEPDPRADVYSVGTIIGEMMFGPDYSPGSKMQGPEAAVDALVKRATAFDPKERYASVEALSEDLTAVIDTGVPMERGADKPPPPPPMVPAPPMGPPKIVDPEEHKSTVEYDRASELQDAVLTTEVQRGHLPPPKRREATAAVPKPVAAASAGRAARPGATKRPPWELIVVVVVALGVIGFVAREMSRSDDVEQIGQPAAVAAAANAPSDTKKSAEPPGEKPGTPVVPVADVAPNDVALASATNAAQTNLVGAEQKAADASAKPADSPADSAATPDAATNKPAGDGAKAPTEKTEKPDGTGATSPEKAESAKEPATGTKCPGGMQLVKSKKLGNYCIDAHEFPGGGATPKTRVSWFQAKSSCEAKGKRLCKLTEWRGACGSRYPYGSTFDADKCNTADEDGFERSIAKTGSFKGCRARSGTYDMVGNVHEWVEEQRIAGGGFESDEEVGSCRYSSPKSPASAAGYIGFRCCAASE